MIVVGANMIVVRIKGGLGNQLSQYAFLRLMQKQYPNVDVKADVSFYTQNRDHQGYELEKRFSNCKITHASTWDILSTTGKLVCQYDSRRRHHIINKGVNFINWFLPGKEHNYIQQTIESGYMEENVFFQLDTRKNWYLEGYWHSYDYASIMKELRRELNFQPCFDRENINCLKHIQERNSVSIHIRRGDYVNSSFDIVGEEYYFKAMHLLCEKVADPFFVVFSDDVTYARRMFEGNIDCDMEYVTWNQGEQSYYDMYLMSKCKHNIIANSTFSYWAAQLNENKNKIVIRPQMQTRERKAWDVEGWILL